MDIANIWSWIVVVGGITGFIFAGRKKWWSWYINIGVQVLWVIYALVSNQPAFLVSAVLYTIVFGRNAYLWTKDVKLNPYEYRKRPVKIQAVQYLNFDSEDGLEFGGRGGKKSAPSWLVTALRNADIVVDENSKDHRLLIDTLEGQMAADVNDWLIRGVNGEIYPCKPEIFEKTYD
jgi:hypothetical protein